MVKRFVSFLLVSSLLCAPLAQAKTGSLWRNTISIHPLFVVAAVNVACFAAYQDLYKQKNEELGKHNADHLKLQKDAQDDAKKKAWLNFEPQARIKGYDVSIKQLHQSNYPEEEIRTLVMLLADLRNSIKSHLQSYNNNKIQSSLRSDFNKLLNPQLLSIEMHLKSKAISQDRKEILSKRKASFKAAQEWASTFDSYVKPANDPKKINELKKKISAKTQERDRLWIVPIALNGFMAMYYGLSYYFGSK